MLFPCLTQNFVILYGTVKKSLEKSYSQSVLKTLKCEVFCKGTVLQVQEIQQNVSLFM